MARFELVSIGFDEPTTHAGAILSVLKTKAGDQPFRTRQSMIVEALNKLPLRQRLLNYEVNTHGDTVVVDMYVENMA
jgi:hypothetical protein